MIVKVCGMRDAQNIKDLCDMSLDIMGFIFYGPSKRYVAQNKEYMDAIASCSCKRAGVFVNETLEQTLEIASRVGLDFVQLHGDESPQICSSLRSRGYRVIKAISVDQSLDKEKILSYQDSVDYILFDTKCAGYGGSGKSFDWSMLEEYDFDKPFLLSGGLNPESLQDILKIKNRKLAGIDLNSGFEIAPALKDTAKLKLFIEKLRANN